MLCAGLYGLNLVHYNNYMTNVVNVLGISNVDYVGPWDEDPATLNDYTSLDVHSILKVGIEKRELVNADLRYINYQSGFDVAGSHNYHPTDDNEQPNLLDAYADWESFADAGNKPEWFTETTLFPQSTAEGIAHMLPAISAGLEKMIIYQAVSRLIKKDATDGPH